MSTVVLLDVSGSMNTPVAADQRRIDVLRTIIDRILPGAPNVRMVAFSDTVAVLEPGQAVPEPTGGTALHLALEHLRALRPTKVIVISDGEPQDKQAAITAARALGCVICTYFCGTETDRAGAAFLRTLALCSQHGVGRAVLGDLREPDKVATDVRLLLAGPAR